MKRRLLLRMVPAAVLAPKVLETTEPKQVTPEDYARTVYSEPVPDVTDSGFEMQQRIRELDKHFYVYPAALHMTVARWE